MTMISSTSSIRHVTPVTKRSAHKGPASIPASSSFDKSPPWRFHRTEHNCIFMPVTVVTEQKQCNCLSPQRCDEIHSTTDANFLATPAELSTSKGELTPTVSTSTPIFQLPMRPRRIDLEQERFNVTPELCSSSQLAVRCVPPFPLEDGTVKSSHCHLSPLWKEGFFRLPMRRNLSTNLFSESLPTTSAHRTNSISMSTVFDDLSQSQMESCTDRNMDVILTPKSKSCDTLLSPPLCPRQTHLDMPLGNLTSAMLLPFLF